MPIANQIADAVRGVLSAFPPDKVQMQDLGAVLHIPDDVLTVVSWEAGGPQGQRHAEGLAIVGRKGVRVFTLEGSATLA